MKTLYALLLVLWQGGCAPGEVEPPPVTSTTTAPLTTTSTLPEPPPPEAPCALPDTGRGERQCYITRARAGVRRLKPVLSSGLLRDMMFADQELVATSRNFLGAIRTCRAHLGKTVPPFFVTPAMLADLAARGFILHDGARELGGSPFIVHPSMLSFIGEGDGVGRLERSHERNCPNADATNPWCGRTGVFRPLLEDFRTHAQHGVAVHMDKMRAIDGRASHLGFDGLRAWCEAQ